MVESGKASQILDVDLDPHLQYSKEALDEGIRSRLIVGLLRDGRAIGALSVFTDCPHRFTEEEVQTFETIANQAAVAIHLSRLHRERLEARQVEQELAIAAGIQANLMPSQIPQIEGIDIAVWYKPCAEVGGDFYDFIDLPEKNLGIAIGDASGKGIPAALLMASVCTSLRVQAENIYDMREVVGRVNRLLHRYTLLEQFATLFYGVFNIRQRVLTFVNAGHNYPLLFRGDQIVPLKTGGPPLGFFPGKAYQEEVIQILPGDILILYTDGFVEAMNRDDEFFEEHRLQQVICGHRGLRSGEIVQALEQAVIEFTGDSARYADDRTAVVLKVYG